MDSEFSGVTGQLSLKAKKAWPEKTLGGLEGCSLKALRLKDFLWYGDGRM